MIRLYWECGDLFAEAVRRIMSDPRPEAYSAQAKLIALAHRYSMTEGELKGGGARGLRIVLTQPPGTDPLALPPKSPLANSTTVVDNNSTVPPPAPIRTDDGDELEPVE